MSVVSSVTGRDRAGRVAQRRERRANLGGGGLEVFEASRGNGDVDAFARQFERDRLADAHAAAGDECGFSVELQVHNDERSESGVKKSAGGAIRAGTFR